MNDDYVYLYFGFDGRCPIGIDDRFPSGQKKSDIESHLKWAEILFDAELFFQAQQQIDLIGDIDTDIHRAQYNLIKARLKIIQYHNAMEHKRRIEFSPGAKYISSGWIQDTRDSIASSLEIATSLAPNCGPAWLTRAEYFLDPAISNNFSQAYEYACLAKDHLGEIPEVLFVLGQALLKIGRVSEAIFFLNQLQNYSDKEGEVEKVRKIAKLEAQCESDPSDISAHFQLGRWCSRHGQRERALQIYTQLVEQSPDRPEGFCGLAQLAYIANPKRLNTAYDQCIKALSRDSNFGPAFELLGGIFESAELGIVGEEHVNFAIEDSFGYYQRAIELDSTSDIAFWRLGEKYIERGNLSLAKTMLEKAAELDTDIDSVYSILAVIYKGTRQPNKHDWAKQKAKDLSPLTHLKKDVEQKILELCGYEY